MVLSCTITFLLPTPQISPATDGGTASLPVADDGGGDPAGHQPMASSDTGSGCDTASGGDPKIRNLTWMLAVVIVLGLPICVGLVTYMRASSSTAEPLDADLGELRSTGASLGTEPDTVADPAWVRPSWAGAIPGLTAFELPAGSSVPFVNGSHRPNLGISCTDEGTNVHVTTGGTAPVAPATSGHVVSLAFDDWTPQPQQWFAAQD